MVTRGQPVSTGVDVRRGDAMGVAMSSVESTGRDLEVVRDPVRELLSEYREILARAERLPWILWSRTRAPHTSLLSRVWRVPRLTLGTSHMVLFHVTRSIDALMRVFAAKAALGELDEEGHRQRDMITTFRASLRPVRWRWFVVGGIVAVVLLGRLLLDIVAHSLDSLAFGRGAEAIDEERLVILRATLEGLASMSSSASGSSVNDFATRLSQAGGTGLFVFAATLFAAAYCVLRPASTAFRLKRQLFNLADEPEDAIYRTTTTWHVRRTTGLYVRERAVHAAAGVENAKEKPFDLGTQPVRRCSRRLDLRLVRRRRRVDECGSHPPPRPGAPLLRCPDRLALRQPCRPADARWTRGSYRPPGR